MHRRELVTMCQHKIRIGKNKGQDCPKRATSDSPLCSFHKKQYEKNKNRRPCAFILPKGKRANENCKKFAITGSLYCAIHKKKVVQICPHVFLLGKKAGQQCTNQTLPGYQLCEKHEQLHETIEEIVKMSWEDWVRVRAEFFGYTN